MTVGSFGIRHPLEYRALCDLDGKALECCLLRNRISQFVHPAEPLELAIEGWSVVRVPDPEPERGGTRVAPVRLGEECASRFTIGVHADRIVGIGPDGVRCE